MKVRLLSDVDGNEAFSIDGQIISIDKSDPVHRALKSMAKEITTLTAGISGRIMISALRYVDNTSPGKITPVLDFISKHSKQH